MDEIPSFDGISPHAKGGRFRFAGRRIEKIGLYWLVSTVLAFVCAGPVSGQTRQGFNPLAVPASSLRCVVLPRAATDSAKSYSTGLHFEEGDDLVDDRTIEAFYDSLGTPVVLVLFARERSHSDIPVTHALSFRFGSGGVAVGFRLLDPPIVDSIGRPLNANQLATGQQRLVPLPIDMTTEARFLADWLWAHRCGRRNTGRPQGNN